MSSSRCMICIEPLAEHEANYHRSCCRRLFRADQPPALPYTQQEVEKLAEQIVRSHVAVPGVQPKLSLHLERDGGGKGGRLTLVGMEGDYILKPPVARYPEMPELEHLTLCMARLFGIETADCGLIEMEGGQRAFITRRMDRIESGKLHMEDLCQITERLTEQKYRGSLEQAGHAIIRHATNPLFDALRFFDLTLFCFLTGNADMHLKNFSLLRLPNGELQLSPAYDLLPTALLLPEDTEETALTLNGKRRRLRVSDFRALGSSLRLTHRQVDNSFSRFMENLNAALALIEKGGCSEQVKQGYQDLLTQRADRLFSPE